MIFISGCPKSSLARSIVYDYFSLPVFVRENTVLAMGENDQLPDYEYAENVVLHLFEIKDGAKITTEVTDVSGKTVLVANTKRGQYGFCNRGPSAIPSVGYGAWYDGGCNSDRA